MVTRDIVQRLLNVINDTRRRVNTLESREYVLLNATQTLTNKTLTTPTIGDFTNAQHDHANAAGGGQLSLTTAVSGVLPAANGGTGVNNATRTLTINTNSGTLAFSGAGYTLTIPKTGTVPVGTGTAGRIAEWVTDANTVQASTLAKTGAGVLTLSAAANYTLTIPATGTAALLGTANVFTAAQRISGGGVISDVPTAATNYGFRIDVANPAISFIVGYDPTDNPMLQAINNTSETARTFMLNPLGGNVVVGSTDNSTILNLRGILAIPDGVTAPSAVSGVVQFYVDTADGDLKVIFGDGTVKTIATDT